MHKIQMIKRKLKLKRVFDMTLSSVGLLVSFPLWITIAALIYLETGRPIFFIQERPGRGGRTFKLIKFRSMVKDAPSKTRGLHDKEVPPEMITKIGRILRNTAMDELPQLVNILKGDMSFVGPRALPGTLDALKPRERALKLSVRPGLTGIAQLYARDDNTLKQKFRFDKVYIKNMGFLLDLKLIFLSFWITLRAKWKSDSKKF